MSEISVLLAASALLDRLAHSEPCPRGYTEQDRWAAPSQYSERASELHRGAGRLLGAE